MAKKKPRKARQESRLIKALTATPAGQQEFAKGTKNVVVKITGSKGKTATVRAPIRLEIRSLSEKPLDGNNVFEKKSKNKFK